MGSDEDIISTLPVTRQAAGAFGAFGLPIPLPTWCGGAPGPEEVCLAGMGVLDCISDGQTAPFNPAISLCQ